MANELATFILDGAMLIFVHNSQQKMDWGTGPAQRWVFLLYPDSADPVRVRSEN